MSNVATTAMMVPIAQAVLEQLKDALENNYNNNSPDGQTALESDSEKDQLLKTVNLKTKEKDEISDEEAVILNRMHNGLCKALMLGIAYCASIGGVGMLTGTGPNLISAGLANLTVE